MEKTGVLEEFKTDLLTRIDGFPRSFISSPNQDRVVNARATNLVICFLRIAALPRLSVTDFAIPRVSVCSYLLNSLVGYLKPNQVHCLPHPS